MASIVWNHHTHLAARLLIGNEVDHLRFCNKRQRILIQIERSNPCMFE